MRRDPQLRQHVVEGGGTNSAFAQHPEVAQHLMRWSVGNHPGVAQGHDPVAFEQFFGLVLDHQQAQALVAQPAHQLEHLAPALRIEVGGRFVKHDN